MELVTTLLYIALAVFIAGALFVGINMLISRLPDTPARLIRPWVFLGPALLALLAALVVPTIRTVILSFKNAGSDSTVGGENYGWIFTNDAIFNMDGWTDMFGSRLLWIGAVLLLVGVVVGVDKGREIGARADFSGGASIVVVAGGIFMMIALFSVMRGVVWNNLFWVVAVTGLSTGLGLAVAVLADRMKGESVAKSFIFLPMAISMVGASVIWRFVYSVAPASKDQIGLLNAAWKGLGGDPQPWTQNIPWNNLFLIIVLVWIQTGFAMVVLSAAIKAVPEELTEAARVDGATESQVFWQVTLPQIRTTVGVVITTLIVIVMKVFDIVKVMTNGEFGTNVIANEMFDQAFRANDFGKGAALAIVLFLAVVPVMILNVNRIRKEAEA
jgi:alpha-glucoside transport system permease protein